MVGDSSSSSSASPTKTQNPTTTAAEEDTIHKNNKGEGESNTEHLFILKYQTQMHSIVKFRIQLKLATLIFWLTS